MNLNHLVILTSIRFLYKKKYEDSGHRKYIQFALSNTDASSNSDIQGFVPLHLSSVSSLMIHHE